MSNFRSILALAFAFVVVVWTVPAVYAQGSEPIKLEASLTAPEGSTSAAKGKAKATYHLKSNGVSEKLSITLQHLERRTGYRIALNGIDLGVFEPKGNSGTVKVQMRRPAKGNQRAIPDTIPALDTLTTIDVYNNATSELVATGAFAVVPED